MGPRVCGYSAFDCINIYFCCGFGDDAIDCGCPCMGGYGPEKPPDDLVPSVEDIMGQAKDKAMEAITGGGGDAE